MPSNGIYGAIIIQQRYQICQKPICEESTSGRLTLRVQFSLFSDLDNLSDHIGWIEMMRGDLIERAVP